MVCDGACAARVDSVRSLGRRTSSLCMKEYWITRESSALPFGFVVDDVLMVAGSTVAVALWAMTPGAAVTPKLQLVLDSVYDGGVGGIVTDNPQWSSEGRE